MCNNVLAMRQDTNQRSNDVPMYRVCRFSPAPGPHIQWSKWHFVVVEGSAEMCICQNVEGGIRLSDQINCDLTLWEQPIPKSWWEVVGYTG